MHFVKYRQYNPTENNKQVSPVHLGMNLGKSNVSNRKGSAWLPAEKAKIHEMSLEAEQVTGLFGIPKGVVNYSGMNLPCVYSQILSQLVIMNEITPWFHFFPFLIIRLSHHSRSFLFQYIRIIFRIFYFCLFLLLFGVFSSFLQNIGIFFCFYREVIVGI